VKKRFSLLALLLCLCALIGCAPQKLGIGKAATLTVFAGETGQKITLADADTIRAITENLNSLSFERGKRANIDGYRYTLTWYDAEGNVIESLVVQSESEIIRDKHLYHNTTEGSTIDLSLLDALFETE